MMSDWFLPYVKPKPVGYKRWPKRKRLKWLKTERHWTTMKDVDVVTLPVDPSKWLGKIGSVE